LPGKSNPLEWGLPDRIEARIEPPWLLKLRSRAKKATPPRPALERELLGWLGESAGTQAGVEGALEALVCGHAMPRLAAVLSPEVWWVLLEHLLAVVADAARIESDPESPQIEPLLSQLLAGELPLTLAYLLPEIAPCRKLKASARKTLSSGLLDLLDGEGLPHAKHLGLMRPLLACWTRCRALGEELKGGCWTAAADEQYQWLVRQTILVTRHDGSHVFAASPARRCDEDLLGAALQLGGDHDDRRIAAVALPAGKKLGKRKPAGAKLPDAAVHSPWAATAVLRSDWARACERLVVVYPGRELRLELACSKDVLLSGAWPFEVQLDGKTAEPVSDWDDVCWMSDEDIDYLELEIELSCDVRVQRQILLAREDRFLLLADVVLGSRPGKLQYRGCLPLCSDVAVRRADDTREALLSRSKRRALVLPLALPEWRADGQAGEMQRTSAGLELRQTIDGSRLYAPLFFDLDRRRQQRRLTWRQLTVAESLSVQPRDVAVGYRVAAGDDQWLIYRSLAEKANRSLLGHNLSSEVLVARFDRSGEVEPLLEAE